MAKNRTGFVYIFFSTYKSFFLLLECMAKSRRNKVSRKKASRKRISKRKRSVRASLRKVSQTPLPSYPPAGYPPGVNQGYPPAYYQQETIGQSGTRGVASGFGLGLGFGAANAAVSGIGSFFSGDDE
jgi:hypothetical protein